MRRDSALIALLAPALAITAGAAAPSSPSKIHPGLSARFEHESGPVKAWVFLTDKGYASRDALDAAVADLARTYNPRAAQRRALRGLAARRGEPAFTERDLPPAPDYILTIAATGATIDNQSRWLNAVSVHCTQAQAERIAALPFVDRLEAVQRSFRKAAPVTVAPLATTDAGGEGRTLNYGNATAQLSQINLINLHDAGFTGQGVIIGILDTGFRRDHVAFNHPAKTVQVLAEYDFVDDDGNTAPQFTDPPGQHDHGTYILGCIAAYAPGALIGGAFDAKFVLCKTEDTTQEVPAEEDDFVAGLEFIEANGADMSTASLGYIDWYTQAQLNGQTAVTTIAMNIHTSLGVHHTNAAGNEGHDANPNTSHLIAPADALKCITCGAVTSSGAIATFSSDGPSADGRIKPEVLARGVSTATVAPNATTGYTSVDGTSLSTPLVAAALACLIQARPNWTVDEMREHLFETSDYFVANGLHDPQFVRGFGVINALAAVESGCGDAGELDVDRSVYRCESAVQITLSDCGPNLNPAAIDVVQITVSSASEPAGEIATLTEEAVDSGEFSGTLTISATDAPGVLKVADGDVVTAAYIDADNGAGGFNIVVTATGQVDCTPPTISAIQVTDLRSFEATVEFTISEVAAPSLDYGSQCGPNMLTVGAAPTTAAGITLSNLQPEQDYYYRARAEDAAGNVTVADGGGLCYLFTTPTPPNYFTQIFNPGTNDLDFRTLEFWAGDVVPYFGCSYPIVELPTDPTGGVTLAFTGDNQSIQVPLPGDLHVFLYDQAYSKIYVGANGYLTFTGPDTDASESLTDHFDTPRISALFDDLSPQRPGASVSYKMFEDRIAITYENVSELNLNNLNTFQIELFTYGRIRISYLRIDATDGLAGLSRGDGLQPDFVMTDLSAMAACGPRPPTAVPAAYNIPMNDEIEIELEAHDEGLPNPPAAISYVVTQYPAHGTLRDGATGQLIAPSALPFVLDTNQVAYTANIGYLGRDEFHFKASDGGTPPDGGDSNVATITIDVGGRQRIYNFSLDEVPPWTVSGQWRFGDPAGFGGDSFGNPDPPTGYTGNRVLGVNLLGDYGTQVGGPYTVTTGPMDLTGVSLVQLRFHRWLNTHFPPFVASTVEVSTDGGANWSSVWEHDVSSPITDSGWSQQSYDLAGVADRSADVRFRWGYRIGAAGALPYSGWNLDDIEVWGLVDAPAICTGDTNCDGAVNFADIDRFIEALGYPGGAGWPHTCPWLSADANADQDVTFADIDAFVALIGTVCP